MKNVNCNYNYSKIFYTYFIGVTWYDLSNNEWMAVKTTIMMITKRQECLNESNESKESYISLIDVNDSSSQAI
jgi:hypothetical protein